jgi:glycosyltransferase involved in cell wall biosynthesis
MKKLSVKLITYNRAAALKRTLEVWNASQLRDIPLQVLDNSSTDSTGELMASVCLENSNITYFRHKQNIGAVGNLLRAYESFETEYCWLLCDDDELQLAHADRLLLALEASPNVILISSTGQRASNYGFKGSCEGFIAQGGDLCYIASFLPGMVFNRALLGGDTLYRCYRAAATFYPHACLVDRIIELNSEMHCLDRPLVNRIPGADMSVTWVDWIFHSLLPAEYMKCAGPLWVDHFVNQSKFNRPWRVLYQVARTKMYTRLSLDRVLHTNKLIPWRHWFFKLNYLGWCLVPRFVFLLVYRLAGKWQPTSGLDSTKRI